MAEKINTTLNGLAQTFEVGIETAAISVIREKAGLKGTKFVCGSGTCGACTVLVDGAAHCSCIMPALHMEGKQIITIEGQAKGDLHPVQKAFLAHDALQCGYCTPGFINEGIAFYNEWRTKNDDLEDPQSPSREIIAAAMAGHYCRCGAYQGIYEAIIEACSGKYDGPEMPEYLRNDGPAKVTGAAKYTTDIALDGQLVGVIFRSTIPHGKIRRLDLSKAQAMNGVKAVLRLKADDHTHYEGEPIAALAAVDRATAHAALQAIEIEYVALPFLTDIKSAMKADAILLTPEDRKTVPTASEAPPFPGKWEGNVRQTTLSISSSEKAKAKRKIENSSPEKATHYEATFVTPTQFHTTLEPHCAVADWKENGQLTVYASTQGVYFLAKDIAKHYDLKEEQVHVIAEHVGGAFGSKLTLHTAIKTAIELSRAAKAPVAVIYSRAEEFTEAGYRPSAEIVTTITADPDGGNAAYTMAAYGNSGYAIGSNIADISGLGYTGISKSLVDYDVLTNFQPGRHSGLPAARRPVLHWSKPSTNWRCSSIWIPSHFVGNGRSTLVILRCLIGWRNCRSGKNGLPFTQKATVLSAV